MSDLQMLMPMLPQKVQQQIIDTVWGHWFNVVNSDRDRVSQLYRDVVAAVQASSRKGRRA
jgi:hypothetical protein